MRSDIISSASDIITWAERTAPAAMPASRDYEASTPEPPSVTFTPIRRGDVPPAWPLQAPRGLKLPPTHLRNPGASGTHRPGGETEEGGRALGRGHHVGRAWAPLSQRQAGTTTQSPSQAISEQHYTALDSSPLENNDKLWWLMKEKKSTKTVCKRGVQYCYLRKNIIGASFW